MAPVSNNPISFSVGPYPAVAWHTIDDQSCCGYVGSYKATQSSAELIGDSDEIRKSWGEEEPIIES